MRKYLVIFAVLLIFPLSAHAQWFRAESDHFIVYSEGSEESLRSFATELEKFDRGVRRLRHLPDPEPGTNRVTVYLMTPGLFREIRSSRSVGGFYRTNPYGSVAFLPTAGTGLPPQATLFHEYTHHIYSVAWSNIAFPGWLGEGLAEFHASAEFRNDGSMVFGREPSYRTGSLRYLTNDQIRAMLTNDTEESGVAIYYTGGWLLTHYLTFAPEREGQLMQYIVALNSAQSLEEAARTAFGDTQRFGSDLARYRRGTSLPAVVVPASDLEIGDITIRPLTSGELATIGAAIRSQSGVGAEEAASIYAAVKPIAESYPDDAGAQRVFAEAAYDVGEYGDVIAAADRAIAADPTMGIAYAYKARAMMNSPDSYADIDDATWIEIRRVIITGLNKEPKNAELLWLYYRSFAEAGTAPPPLAVRRLYQAFGIQPQFAPMRLAAAHQLLVDGNGDEARALLRPLAFSVHRSSTTDRARAIVDAIDAGDLAKALQISESKGDEEEEGSDEPGDDNSILPLAAPGLNAVAN